MAAEKPPLQTLKYKGTTAATSHVINSGSASAWWSADIATPGGSVYPSAIKVVISYGGTAALQVSSVTDDAGNTYSRVEDDSNGSGVNGETWLAYNVAGGVKPAITINLASSLSIVAVAAELQEVLPWANPVDTTYSRIDSTNSTLRSTLNLGVRDQRVEVITGGIAWNSNTITTITNGSAWTTDVYEYDSSTHLGAAIGHRTDENESRAGTVARCSFKVSTTSITTPVCVMSVPLKRCTVFGCSTEDGIIDNTAGVAIVDLTYGLVQMTSALAPDPSNPSSEKTDTHWFVDPTQFGALPSGLVLGASGHTFNPYMDSGYDSGASVLSVYLYTDKTNVNGSTLDTGDWGKPTTNAHSLGTTPMTPGAFAISIAPSEIDLTTLFTARMSAESTGLDSSYAVPFVHGSNPNVPAYLRVVWDWPVAATSIPQRTLLGVGT